MAVVELGSAACSPLTSYACQPECPACTPGLAGHRARTLAQPRVEGRDRGSDLTLTTASFVSWASPFPSLGLNFPHL